MRALRRHRPNRTAGCPAMTQVVRPVASGGPGPRYPMRPAARPSFVVIGWRWRREIGVVVATALCVVVLLRVLGPEWTIGTFSALAGVVSLPPCRGWLRRRAWCVITEHRVRTGCAQACIRSASGKLPVLLATVSRPYGQRVLLWCRAGTCADDFAIARGMLAAACWASEVRVFQDNRHAQLLALDVVRSR
jgi:hypothetical protein